MDRSPLSRRDFNRLSSVAFGGLLAGGSLGCNNSAPPPVKNAAGGSGGSSTEGEVDSLANFLVGEKHACRGLNICKGHDKEGDNDCAGQGDCATFEATCGGSNLCKGQGGCGETPGFNECAGKGSCHIPLMASAWPKAREVFEAKMKADGKPFGDAPAKKKAVPKVEEPADDMPAEETDAPADDADAKDESEQ